MKDLSFHFLKNSLGAKMRKGFRNFCNDHSSTSTLNQQRFLDHHHYLQEPTPPSLDAAADDNRNSTSPTLEDMILQLEMEEAITNERNAAKLNKLNNVRCRRHHHNCYYDNDSVPVGFPTRMSCVNSSDILRSARNALNQYPPRFSLDGKDSQYRSSFRNLQQNQDYYAASRRKSVCCSDPSRRLLRETFGHPNKGCYFPPPTLLPGDTVVWCKPGVIAKLMGLDAMPVPVNIIAKRDAKATLNSCILNESQNRRRRSESHETNQRRLTFERKKSGNRLTSCSNAGYCVMKLAPNDEQSWSIPRFRR